ncbi:MAG TPA: histidine phosphatase family protein [Burkholderiales bacterium]|nr:histidine phosphatase family protein [Burkholderiales bacterium]
MKILLFACLAFPAVAAANDALWSLLEKGGQAVLVRHTLTTPGVGDPPGMRLDDCATQRNLSVEGRVHARRIGEEFRRRNIPVERVLSSPWCRCLETARLAFGKAEVSQPLSNLFGRYDNRESQVRRMRELLKEEFKGNLILVTHGSTILALTGVSPATGEMVIVSPDGKVIGRLVSE